MCHRIFYQENHSETKTPMGNAIVRVYTAILQYAAEVRKTQQANRKEGARKCYCDSGSTTFETEVPHQRGGTELPEIGSSRSISPAQNRSTKYPSSNWRDDCIDLRSPPDL
ncbi:hypothetical protein TSTA_014570 [Talaromyces stipitatus ATCC 10500]|uniref:Uncharacterized protein n=1 Tax=Talaromyces stipitatus (strain ATCC 10500 / CBS 375.48 / QM 6759 / NRRL 1006) TaxID=441959 RepID=B8MGY4_TALSN|nr:uncharacterized protein TSTA_014570 [Talaromyces stipitatus ATCC 10500]EED16365.1 hypothetical protein TSTA_014570 [Talaromyces stipitatus ATCC 10500]